MSVLRSARYNHRCSTRSPVDMPMKPFAFALCVTLAIGLICCSKPVADWDAPDIESWIKREWSLADVTVTDNGDGTYAASGKNEAGTSFTFRIEKKPDVKELHCARLTGDDATPDAMAIKNYQ